MLIDITQQGNLIKVSHTSKDSEGEIVISDFDIRETNGIGTYDYQICDPNDPDKEPALVHFKDNLPIKKIPTYKFDFDELREFLLTSVPKEKRDDIYSFTRPDIYMVDIEINVGENGDVFPNPYKAEFAIDSIQITAPNLNTITLTCHDKALNCDIQRAEIEDKINEHYANVPNVIGVLVDRLKYSHIKFDSEKEMLEYFFELVRDKLHVVSFWNGDGFDIPYFWHRCPKIGVDMSLMSPTNELSEFNKWGKHRYQFDMMLLVEKYAKDIPDMSSLRLDLIANQVIGVGKLKYEGSYKDLYNGDVKEYLTYGAIDTISMQLIQIKKKYTEGLQALVYYCRGSIYDSNQVTALVHSLIWDELYADNKINAVPYVKQEKKKYEGGYVKDPARKYCMFPVCIDFSALYPRVMQSFNFSFENLVGNTKSKEEAKEYLDKGYVVSVNGNIYKNDKDYTLRKLETKLLDERYAYKGLQQEVFLNILPIIEKELTDRKIHIPSGD